MGNCTSKKSSKSLKLSGKKPLFSSKMDKEQDTYSKGLSKKIAPFTKGEVTSFGFKKKLSSQLPVPITLTSNGHSIHEPSEKVIENGNANYKNMSDGYQSGSSVESLCPTTFRSTPKMVRKSRDLVKQIAPTDSVESESYLNSVSLKNVKTSANIPPSLAVRNENNSASNGKITSESSVNRFGFRQPTPPRATNNTGKIFKTNGHITRTAFLTGQDPHETGSNFITKKFEPSSRSRSEGPREAFFKQTLQPANSVQSGLNQSKAFLSNWQPGKFTFQTSHLPRPQFAIRMPDPKTAKTAANYYRKGEVRSDLNSSVEDSGFESHQSSNNTLEKHIEILDSSPGSKVRQRLPALKGKKLEMKIVGNKFELMKKDEETSSDVVTEVSLIKLPPTNIRSSTNTTIINTGLVEQRTNQYLKKISQSFNKKNLDEGVNDPIQRPPKSNTKLMVDFNSRDEGLGAESEEEKLFKDSKKSEKSSMRYSMSDGCGDGEEMLPGETMAEDVSLCLSFEEETSSSSAKNIPEKPVFMPEIDVTPNTIRLDALKLSKELKYKNSSVGTRHKGNDSTVEFLAACEKDEDTFPSDSILEQLSDSDSLGDKNENKNNDKEKNIKIANVDLDKEDLGIEIDEEENLKSDTDVDENDLDLNIDETENKDDNKNCLGTASPDSPGTPTHASNSLSLSDGRDFLIDDEIADQPQLCMSESYVDCSCQEESKTTNQKSMTVNNEFVTCCDVQTLERRDEVPKLNRIGKEVVEIVDIEIRDRAENKEKRRLHSDETLSPCESITSDDLMLDFEGNSLEETGAKFDVNDNVSVENLDVPTNRDEMLDVFCERVYTESGDEKSLKAKEGSNNCSTPASAKRSEVTSRVCSPYRSSRSSPADDESINLDKISYQNMFQDIIGIKAMLLKLKRLLLESEGGLQENGRIYPDIGALDNAMEDELTDLRRQVLFLQQQLEEREKMVQVLRLKISQTSESETILTDSRKSNAATQTGLDQFQQDFPHFRIFQTTPVV